MRAAVALLACASLAQASLAQDGTPPQRAPGSDGIAGFGGCGHAARVPSRVEPGAPAPLRNTALLCIEDRDETGFVDLFNGRDLSGWIGEAGRWSVANGVLTGQTTAADPLPANTFLIWTGGSPRDFDLRFEWRLSAGGNSGVQYRSEELHVPALGRYVLRGPQFDMGGRDEAFTGNIFEERGPTFLANRGSFAWERGGRRETIGFVGGGAPRAAGYGPTRALVRTGDWNEGEIVARGDTVVHLINRQVTGIFIDESTRRRQVGRIGFQLHVGPPMSIEFRRVRLRALTRR